MMFRQLNEKESKEFQQWARENDPDMDKWEIYHPVCRAIWMERGFFPKTRDEILEHMTEKIKIETERLEGLEERLALVDDGDTWELESMIDNQHEYLAGLNEGLQRYLNKGGK